MGKDDSKTINKVSTPWGDKKSGSAWFANKMSTTVAQARGTVLEPVQGSSIKFIKKVATKQTEDLSANNEKVVTSSIKIHLDLKIPY